MSRSLNNRTFARLALLLAISVIFGIVEQLLVIPIPLPGIKLGLANCIGLVLLYFYSYKEYIVISLLRVILVALLFSGFGTAFILSLSGMLFSIIAVLYIRHVLNPSIYGLSIISASFHGFGQVIVVAFLYNMPLMITYFPLMLISGLISGYFIALISAQILVRLKKF